MRIGVISDTHIPDRADKIPQAILDDFKNVELVLHAGDLVDLEVIDELKSSCANVIAVFGNMDPEAVRKKLNAKEVIQAGKYKIGLMHGFGAPNNLIDLMQKSFAEEQVDIVVFGHSHSPLNERIGNILFFNPGSVTDKICTPYNSYGILEIDDEIKARIIKL